jgi:hypothetical protein
MNNFRPLTHDFDSLRRDLIAVAIKNGPRRARRASFVDLDISIVLSKDAAVPIAAVHIEDMVGQD